MPRKGNVLTKCELCNKRAWLFDMYKVEDTKVCSNCRYVNPTLDIDIQYKRCLSDIFKWPNPIDQLYFLSVVCSKYLEKIEIQNKILRLDMEDLKDAGMRDLYVRHKRHLCIIRGVQPLVAQ